jgi:hypothetical protein
VFTNTRQPDCKSFIAQERIGARDLPHHHDIINLPRRSHDDPNMIKRYDVSGVQDISGSGLRIVRRPSLSLSFSLPQTHSSIHTIHHSISYSFSSLPFVIPPVPSDYYRAPREARNHCCKCSLRLASHAGLPAAGMQFQLAKKVMRG